MKVRGISSALGVEISGIDVSCGLSSSIVEDLSRMIDGYLLLIIRQQDLTIEQQLSFTKNFGSIEQAWEDKHPNHPCVQLLSNVGQHPRNFKGSSQYWHTDRSFVSRPSLFTCLYAVEVPVRGGDTLFANMQAAYDKLSSDKKLSVSKLRTIHSFRFRFPEIMKKKGVPSQKIKGSIMNYPDVIHPLVRTHPNTGKESLYLNELCISRILNLKQEESEILLQELYTHSLRNEFIYRHLWQHGDLLIWDNASLMHRGTPLNPLLFRRILHRITTAGPFPS